MFLIVGLGNPGGEYSGTRHNAGFMVAEELLRARELGRTRNRYLGRWCESRIDGRPVAILLPQTYMNKSGESVNSAASKKHISSDRIIVIHDDMDFPFGTVRVRFGGGMGGHKGLQSIASCLGTPDFNRVRVGIGRPQEFGPDPKDWVLSSFDESEDEVSRVIDTAAACVEAIILEGVEAAMNRYNADIGRDVH